MTQPLAISALKKFFGNKPAVSNVSFDIQAAEIVGLLGVNGAGKSTLIKSMLDLTEIDDGAIELFGEAHRLTASRRNLSYLPEQFRPPYFATGLDVLNMVAGIDGVQFKQVDIAQYCESLALDQAVLHQPCKTYSKGMRQKLGLIACLLSNKSLLILDEPMSGLDPLARRLFKDCIIEQRAKQNAVLFSTHLLDDIESVCDRVLVLDQGQLKFDGPIAKLLETTGKATLESAFLTTIGK
ncbi:MAG: ABC transporter ATP-binding protein [Pseudomonadota bacterium]